MSSTVRNALAVVAGIAIGSAVNMALVALGPLVIPPPAGVDVSTAEGLKAGMPLFEPRHFLAPFLAHALGTLAGALAAFRFAATHRARIAFAIGVVFLAGGVAASLMLPAPAWFIALDLVAAYLPMAWLGIRLGGRTPMGRVAERPAAQAGDA